MTPKFKIGDRVFIYDKGLKEKTIYSIEITIDDVWYKFREDMRRLDGFRIHEKYLFVSKEQFINSL